MTWGETRTRFGKGTKKWILKNAGLWKSLERFWSSCIGIDVFCFTLVHEVFGGILYARFQDQVEA
jgi:hypothetical protein